MNPFSIPKLSLSTFNTGAKQLVVQDAADKRVSDSSITSSFTPYTTVFTFPLQGALTNTFFAPASKCILASSSLVNLPVHSNTKSTPNSPQGSNFGSFSAYTFTFLPSTIIPSSS